MAEGVKAARSLLKHLARPLKDIEDVIDGPGWVQRLSRLQDNSGPCRVLVGVAGRTGAGKSSIINALLDEDRVLPTNGLRACTAVVTEISWNPSDDPAERYRAEIEFVQPEDWHRELARLYHDLEDAEEQQPSGEQGAEEETTTTAAESNAYGESSASEAGIALAKMKAVFPTRATSKEDLLRNCSLGSPMSDERINGFLGTVRAVTASKCHAFYAQLQEYLDSRKNAGLKRPLGGTWGQQQQKSDEEMCLWPLIKVVRVYLKSEALSTGVVLVDLPGSGDYNLARDTVAERYITQCAAIWIVSPIARAVDDKEARQLLGRSFRRQLVLDGSYSNITFVCTKTDDISVREVAESLDTTDEVGRVMRQLAEVDGQLEVKKQSLQELKGQVEEAASCMDSIRARLDILEKIGLRAFQRRRRNAASPANGQSTTAGGHPAKRARYAEEQAINGDGSGGNRGHQLADTAIDASSHQDHGLSENDALGQQDDHDPTCPDGQQDMAPEALGAEIEMELRRTVDDKAKAMARLTTLHVAVERAQEEHKSLEHQRSRLLNERVAICMQLRNAYSRTHIAKDFMDGQAEIYEESAALAHQQGEPVLGRRSSTAPAFDRASAPNGNSSNSMAVFCVSSRAYQNFCGRLDTDEASLSSSPSLRVSGGVLGYRDIGETEIPRLRQHAKRLGDACLTERDRKILQDVRQLLTSLTVWATSSVGGFGMQIHLDQERRGYELRHLDQAHEELRKDLALVSDQFVFNLRQVIEVGVFSKMNKILERCKDEAPLVVESWSGPRKDGGLPFNTYRAVCRRGGNKTASRNSRAFNEELVASLFTSIAPTWTVAFDQYVPAALKDCQTATEQLIDQFAQRMQSRSLLKLSRPSRGEQEGVTAAEKRQKRQKKKKKKKKRETSKKKGKGTEGTAEKDNSHGKGEDQEGSAEPSTDDVEDDDDDDGDHHHDRRNGLATLFDQEIRACQHHMREAIQVTARDHIDAFRRDTHRLPLACVCVAMQPAYKRCAEQSGEGCMARMRDIMAAHVAVRRAAMYADMTASASARFAVLAGRVRQALAESQSEWLGRLRGDCRNMIVGVEAPETTRSAWVFVHGLLERADGMFATAAAAGL